MARNERPQPRPKPTAEQLGVDLAALEWHRSGSGNGSFEVAFVRGRTGARPSVLPGNAGHPTGDGQAGARADWVLLRVAGDPARRVLVYDRTEWACFLDGVRNGEFDLESPLADSAVSDPASN